MVVENGASCHRGKLSNPNFWRTASVVPIVATTFKVYGMAMLMQ